MKQAVLRIFLLIATFFLSMQCQPLYLQDAGEPVPVSGVPYRQEAPASSEENNPVLQEERLILQPGDNLGKMLLAEIPDRELASDLVILAGQELDLRRMQPGQEVRILRNQEEVVEIQLPGENRIVRVYKTPAEWKVTSLDRQIRSLIRYKEALVESNLYNAAVDSGIPLSILMEMIQLFSFEVDFQRDIYKNDIFQVAYEERLDEENQVIGYGRVVFAYLYSNGAVEKHELFRYVDQDGAGDYYNSKGESIRRELLKTPVNGAYISSGYGMRVNPFLGYNKMHKGIDFAVAQGTPIYAAGSGTVVQAGWSNVYGNYVRIRHANFYETLYAHMVNFGRGIRRGIRVEQGQVIGYVGNTGMSTGPHCHYEVFYYGSNVNPSTVKFPPGKTLTGQELELFLKRRDSLLASFL